VRDAGSRLVSPDGRTMFLTASVRAADIWMVERER
jgi:hypothetical protein